MEFQKATSGNITFLSISYYYSISYSAILPRSWCVVGVDGFTCSTLRLDTAHCHRYSDNSGSSAFKDVGRARWIQHFWSQQRKKTDWTDEGDGGRNVWFFICWEPLRSSSWIVFLQEWWKQHLFTAVDFRAKSRVRNEYDFRLPGEYCVSIPTIRGLFDLCNFTGSRFGLWCCGRCRLFNYFVAPPALWAHSFRKCFHSDYSPCMHQGCQVPIHMWCFRRRWSQPEHMALCFPMCKHSLDSPSSFSKFSWKQRLSHLCRGLKG
jgi:hypothetical protein